MNLKHKTYTPKQGDLPQAWRLIDGSGQHVGRLAAFIAQRLRGKHLPQFTPHANPNVHIVVVNASALVFTGVKMREKRYYRHSGYPGGIREITAEKLQVKKPGEILRHAVKGMLPHNRLGADLLKNLRIFGGPEHDHQAQQPTPLALGAVDGASEQVSAS
jgi:large subunit ribosomal protein L13